MMSPFASFATLWDTITADVGASLLVVANALCLLRSGGGSQRGGGCMMQAVEAMAVGKFTLGH